MKRIVEEVAGAGLEKLLGKRITCFCANYIYTGDLIGVNDTCVLLKNAGIVYETGELTTSQWKDFQPLPHKWYIMKGAIESFGEMK